MFLKVVVVVTLFTSLLGAADIFSVRSFTNRETKAKIPVNGQLFGDRIPQILIAQVSKAHECAIPLVAVKPGKVNDGMAKFANPSLDKASVMPPPMPACKGWN